MNTNSNNLEKDQLCIAWDNKHYQGHYVTFVTTKNMKSLMNPYMKFIMLLVFKT